MADAPDPDVCRNGKSPVIRFSGQLDIWEYRNERETNSMVLAAHAVRYPEMFQKKRAERPYSSTIATAHSILNSMQLYDCHITSPCGGNTHADDPMALARITVDNAGRECFRHYPVNHSYKNTWIHIAVQKDCHKYRKPGNQCKVIVSHCEGGHINKHRKPAIHKYGTTGRRITSNTLPQITI